MPKVITALIATAAGLAALLSFRSHSGPGTLGGSGNTGSALAGASSPQAGSPNASAGSGGNPAPAPSTSAASRAPTHGTTTAPPAAPKTKDGTYTGNSEDTQYGPVQVRATVTGGKLTDVTVLQVPDNGRYEDQIVTVALPILRSEALSKQSANIDIVSGATFTSQGYAQSLQSALDQAGL